MSASALAPRAGVTFFQAGVIQGYRAGVNFIQAERARVTFIQA